MPKTKAAAARTNTVAYNVTLFLSLRILGENEWATGTTDDEAATHRYAKNTCVMQAVTVATNTHAG